ncbi:hypothetical protein LTR84_000732 [Exophiala bonariae]|uniref:Transcription factor domain-containing protein n=1 Tax=Exophiala bonariae TaxID=1690606 RepID=A0AAV9NV40_9EURO|nr:hypothetical protein LTR84_000732 [Exophiala bonariae]
MPKRSQFEFIDGSPAHTQVEKELIKAQARSHAAKESHARRRMVFRNKGLSGKQYRVVQQTTKLQTLPTINGSHEYRPLRKGSQSAYVTSGQSICNLCGYRKRHLRGYQSDSHKHPSCGCEYQTEFESFRMMFNRPALWPDWDSEEVVDLQFFIEVLGTSVRSYSDGGFFNIVVPCLANFDVGIRNLVLAVACTHRNILSPKQMDPAASKIKALKRCNSAVDLLAKSSDVTPSEALQASCILLACWYMLRLDSKGAANCMRVAEKLCHMDSNLQLSSRMVSARNTTDPEATSNYRRSTFATIITGVVAKKLIDTATISVYHTWTESQNYLALELNLSSHWFRYPIRDTHDLLGSIEILSPFYTQLRANVAYHACISRSSSIVQDLLGHIEKIATALNMATGSNEHIAFVLNVIWYWLTYYYTGFHCHVLSASEMSWDKYTIEFVALVVRAERYLSQRASQKSSRYIFLPVGTIVQPLWFTAVHCREPTIRRRAISLLLKHHYNESGVDSWLAGQVARELVYLEENQRDVRTALDVDECDRVLLRGFKCEHGQLYLLYIYATDVGQPESTIMHRHPFSIPKDPHGVVDSMRMNTDVSYLHFLVALVAQTMSDLAPRGSLVPILR